MITDYNKVKRKFQRLNRAVELIDANGDPRSRNKIYNKLLAENTPAILYSRFILELCTRDSIEKNYDNILAFYHDNCGLSKEYSEKIINEIHKNLPLEPDYFNKHKKLIFSSRWDKNDDEVFKKSFDKFPINKDGFYCVYFSEDCTYDEVEYYLLHQLRRELKRRTTKSSRIKTRGLADRCLIGWLTIRGFKPKNIEESFLKLYGVDELEKTPYINTINRIRNRIKKENWFSEAEKELRGIFNERSYLNKTLDDYNDQLLSLCKDKKTYQEKVEIYNKKPRFLELSFCNDKKPTFHVKYVK